MERLLFLALLKNTHFTSDRADRPESGFLFSLKHTSHIEKYFTLQITLTVSPSKSLAPAQYIAAMSSPCDLQSDACTYIYTCIYTYMYIHAYVCVKCIHVYTCICMYVYACMYVCRYARAYVRVCTHLSACMKHVHTSPRAHTHEACMYILHICWNCMTNRYLDINSEERAVISRFTNCLSASLFLCRRLF